MLQRKVIHICLFWLKLAHCLFPQDSESRQIKLLDGFWDFRADNSTSRDTGMVNKWYLEQLKKTGSVINMPVPSSYNDITQDIHLRDFIGWVWYGRDFFVPKAWNIPDKQRVVLRFESCHYYCVVWVNGKKLMEHDGGHLPFEAEVTDLLNFGESNFMTVAANNTLLPTTLPPGSVEYLTGRHYPPGGYYVQNLQMDFFNYAGIHRPVKLYTTPTVYLHDITLETKFSGAVGKLNFTSSVAELQREDDNGKDVPVLTNYEVYDANENKVAAVSGENLLKGEVDVPDVNLWWPVDMGHTAGYLYTLKITVSYKNTIALEDVYRLKFGFRTISVDKGSFRINDVPFYFKGFGMHEDTDIRGKGLDLPTLAKNFNLIEWMHANAFRTSHYPYADEFLYLADEQGIVVIDECPGVGIEEANMGPENLAHHKDVMKELIHRDKNHPSVVMWSVANEPKTQLAIADKYFKEVISYTKELDTTRPVTFVGNQSPYDDKAVKYVDVVCYNHYYAWYHDFGMLDLITFQLESDLKLWYNITGKLMILSEYGADSVLGLNQNPPVMFTEDFQVDAVKRYFPMFDKYREEFFIGELIWNFADFATAQSVTRVAGNKKGIFTRNRQPKHVAYVLRDRYKELSSVISKKSDIDIAMFGKRDDFISEEEQAYGNKKDMFEVSDGVDLITV